MKFILTLTLVAAITRAISIGAQAGPVHHSGNSFVKLVMKSAANATEPATLSDLFAAHSRQSSPPETSKVVGANKREVGVINSSENDSGQATPQPLALSHKRKKKHRVCSKRVNNTTTTYTTTMTPVKLPTSAASRTASVSPISPAAPKSTKNRSSCFPALNFTMPVKVPSELDDWWCSTEDEVGWLGFSYDISWCPNRHQMLESFKRMRTSYNARYVRIYGSCDKSMYTDQMIDTAWEAGVGVYPLIWFGYDGDDKWKTRRSNIVKAIKNNAKGPYVVRGVVVGSEPIFDGVLPPDGLAAQITSIQKELSPWTMRGDVGMQVTVSEMPYAYSVHGNAPSVFQAEDVIHANILPFFDRSATTATASIKQVQDGIKYLKQYGRGKKIIVAQTGWPSNQNVWKANSGKAVASKSEQQAYFKMLDDNACGVLLDAPKGGVAWFSHVYTDYSLSGWGLLTSSFQSKFPFHPRTSC